MSGWCAVTQYHTVCRLCVVIVVDNKFHPTHITLLMIRQSVEWWIFIRSAICQTIYMYMVDIGQYQSHSLPPLFGVPSLCRRRQHVCIKENEMHFYGHAIILNAFCLHHRQYYIYFNGISLCITLWSDKITLNDYFIAKSLFCAEYPIICTTAIEMMVYYERYEANGSYRSKKCIAKQRRQQQQRYENGSTKPDFALARQHNSSRLDLP